MIRQQNLGEVIQRVDVATCKLDDISEIEAVDFLKIDIQGGELAVFQGGRQKLSQSVVIQTEVSFVNLYQGQPSFGEVDLELRHQGFLPHCFAGIKHWPIAPCIINNDPRRALNQLLEADIVYVRDISRPEMMSDEQLKYIALIAHTCYRSYDLALRCVMLLIQRGTLSRDAYSYYLKSLAN